MSIRIQRSAHSWIVRLLRVLCMLIAGGAILYYVLLLSGVTLAAPFGPSSISGRVVDTHGKPIPGISVGLFRYPYDFTKFSLPYPTPLLNTYTDEDGNYSFTFLNSGVYRILFQDYQIRYARQYYPNSPSFDRAEDITVFAEQVKDVDAQLIPGVTISGTISWVTSAIMNRGLQIEIYEQIMGNWERIEVRTLFWNPTHQHYEVAGLAGATVRVCIKTQNALITSPPLGCYHQPSNDESSKEIAVQPNVLLADDIELPKSGLRTNINVQLYDLTQMNSGKRIEGIVQLADGQPAIGVEVFAQYVKTDLIYGPVFSNQDGKFFIALPNAGEYIVGLNVQSPLSDAFHFGFDQEFIGKYYDNAEQLEQAKVITITENFPVATIKTTIARAASIEGSVHSVADRHPMSNILVTLYKSENQTWQKLADSLSIDPSGTFVFKGLQPGIYTVSASTVIYRPSGQPDYVDQQVSGYYQASSLTNAHPITITEAGQAIKDIDIYVGTDQFAGLITGVATLDSQPLPKIEVELFRKTDQIHAVARSPILYTFTNDSGTFAIPGLFNGEYQIRFSDPTGTYATIFYPDTPLLEQAQSLRIDGNTVISNINPTLTLAGAISGNLQNPNREPVVGATITLIEAKSGQTILFNRPQRTDKDGKFVIKGLVPATYFLQVTHSSWGETPVEYGINAQGMGNQQPKAIYVSRNETTQLELTVPSN